MYRYKKEKCKDFKHGMQIWCTRHFLALHLLGFKETEDIGVCRPLRGISDSSATFMCRRYLVAYNFIFDFILWREPSTSCASGCSGQILSTGA